MCGILHEHRMKHTWPIPPQKIDYFFYLCICVPVLHRTQNNVAFNEMQIGNRSSNLCIHLSGSISRRAIPFGERTSHKKPKFLHNFHFDGDACPTRYILTKMGARAAHRCRWPVKKKCFIMPCLMCFLHVSRLINPTHRPTTPKREGKKAVGLSVCCDAWTSKERELK